MTDAEKGKKGPLLVDAKIAASEARQTTGMARIEGKIDLLLLETKHVGKAADDAKEEARLAKVAASNIKWNFGFSILAAVGALSAVILTMWTLSYQIADTVRQTVGSPGQVDPAVTGSTPSKKP